MGGLAHDRWQEASGATGSGRGKRGHRLPVALRHADVEELGRAEHPREHAPSRQALKQRNVVELRSKTQGFDLDPGRLRAP